MADPGTIVRSGSVQVPGRAETDTLPMFDVDPKHFRGTPVPSRSCLPKLRTGCTKFRSFREAGMEGQNALPRDWFALRLLMKSHFDERIQVQPRDYLSGAGEVLAMTFVVCWTVTFIFNPRMMADNPLRSRLGYNNLCVGWDKPPANYVGSMMYIPSTYLVFRFLYFNTQHAYRTRMAGWRRILAADILFLMSACAFGLVFVVTPDVSVWVHSIPFLSYIVTRANVVLQILLNQSEPLTQGGRIFSIVYTFVSVVFPIIVVCEFLAFDYLGGQKSPFPSVVTFMVDYTWFLCLPLTARFLPKAVVNVHISTDEVSSEQADLHGA